ALIGLPLERCGCAPRHRTSVGEEALGLERLAALEHEEHGPADPEVEEAWRLEIERRVGQIDRGEVQLVDGDEVFARLRRRLA
ncbi:MAG: addiction module protein, partial [Burkholderiales bacterium]